mmetsp:Transcript_10931/g.30683  ORF Transcript_10931/g.30683 Transcript_10931/m.30683 type:complete len:128 (+) Transcript_10931:418-801(+)
MIPIPLSVTATEGHALLAPPGSLDLKGLILLVVVNRSVRLGIRQDQNTATRENVADAFRKALLCANRTRMRSVAVRCPVTSRVCRGMEMAEVEEVMKKVLDDHTLFEGQERILEVVFLCHKPRDMHA